MVNYCRISVIDTNMGTQPVLKDNKGILDFYLEITIP